MPNTTAPARRKARLSLLLPPALALALAAASLPALAQQPSREERTKKHPELFQFPYIGRGDPDHSFRHPYLPSPSGEPIAGWLLMGTSTVTRSHSSRDVVRLTSASQANQGVLYNGIRTQTNNFNGYFDIQMESVRESHEAADGMGFFFTEDRPRLGSAMGITHSFRGLGIIVDTFSNSRTRHVPYLYAYVSDGSKEWNPDTDGSDTELTRGCQLNMDTVIRVYVQFVDGDLHVGVAMNPRTPHRWHTCFKATNVQMPFSQGGFLAFAGETGHFFAMHEVHDAVFIDEERYVQIPKTEKTEARGQAHYEEYQKPILKHETNADPSTRVHVGKDPSESLSGSLDLQVSEVFQSLSSAIRQLGDKESQDTKLRLDGVRDVTTHMVKEMEQQKREIANAIEVLRELKEGSTDLMYNAKRFATQVKGMHTSLRSLRERVEETTDSHEDMHSEVSFHNLMLRKGKGKSGSGVIILFFVIQMLLIAGVLGVNKVNTASRKMGRMV